MDDCATVAIEHMGPDGTPLLQFPLDQICRGQGWALTPALPTAPSARSGPPAFLSEDEDDGPPSLVSCQYADEGGFMDSAAAKVPERMLKG
jgi:hypothetical protein